VKHECDKVNITFETTDELWTIYKNYEHASIAIRKYSLDVLYKVQISAQSCHF